MERLERQQLWTAVIGGGALVIAFIYLWRRQPKQYGYPPGPFALPLLGNLLQVIAAGSMAKFINNQREKFGDVYTVELSGDRRVVLSGYDILYKVFVQNSDISSNRTISYLPENMQRLAAQRPGVIWSPYPQWKKMRTAVINILKEEGMGKSVLEVKILNEIQQLCSRYFDGGPEVEVDLIVFSKATNNILSEMMFGGRSDYDDPTLQRMIDTVNTMFSAFLSAAITKNLPLLNYFGASALKVADTEFMALVNEMEDRLARRKESFDAQNPKDMFDVLLIQQRDQPDVFSDDAIVAASFEMYTAGVESTSTVLRWLFLYSCSTPGVLERVREEIEQVIGMDRHPSYADRMSMPYTEAVIWETLRLANTSPLSLPHTLSRALEVDNKLIPAGAELMLNMGSVLYDETLFEDPLVFKPDRYLTGDVKLKKQRTIPFSLGRRICPGESLARMEIFLFYTTIVQNYQVQLAARLTKDAYEPIESLTNCPKPYKVKFIKRTP